MLLHLISRGRWRDKAEKRANPGMHVLLCLLLLCCTSDYGYKQHPVVLGPAVSPSNNPSVHSKPQPGDHLAMAFPTWTHAQTHQEVSSRCQDSNMCPPTSLHLPSAQRGVSSSPTLVVAPHWLASVHLQPKSNVFYGPALAREPNKLLFHQRGYREVHTFSGEVRFPFGKLYVWDLCEEVVWYNKRSSIK